MTRTPHTARTTRTKMALRIGALLLGTSALCGVGLTTAYAVTRTWNPSTNDWFDANNWLPNAVPGNGDAAIVASNSTTAFISGGSATSNLAELDVATGGVGGEVRILTGGILNVTNGVGTIYVGKNGTGSTGFLNVNGANSTVNASSLVVGFDGTATTDFENGSVGNLGATFVAQNVGSVGHLLINASTVNTGILILGGSGTANVAIGSGAVVTSSSVVMADVAGTSSALVDGPNTKWDISAGTLTVGNHGNATAIIQGGATLLTKGVDIAVGAGTASELNVNGAGTIWTDTGATRVGVGGSGILSVQNGGVGSTGLVSVGVNAGSDGTIVVDGATSRLTTQALQLGLAGPGTLSISGGGQLTTLDGIVGNGGLGLATVTGAGSKWDLGTSTLTVGASGTQANVLTVSTGATMSSGAVTIGRDVGARGTLTLTGASSTYTPAGAVIVGGSGTGTLNVQNNSILTGFQALTVAADAGSVGDVTIDGSSRIDAGATIIGQGGAATMEITNAGKLTSTAIYALLANTAGSSAVVSIDGTSSIWSTGTNTIFVGEQGAASVTVSHGGLLSTLNGITLGDKASSSGTLTVQDGSSTVTATNGIGVGFAGQGTLIVKNGGLLTSGGEFDVATTLGSTGDVQIDGASTRMTTTARTRVGVAGAATMEITNNGVLTSQGDATMAEVAASTATVLIDNAGWDISGQDLQVAGSGTANLTVSGGGTIVSNTAHIAFNGAGTGTVNITGANSHWTNTGFLFVGQGGNGTLNISAGGRVTTTSNFVSLGASAGAVGTATVDGVGSIWDSFGQTMTIGVSGTGTVNVRNSGAVVVGDAELGLAASAASGTLDVNGAGSSFASAGEIHDGISGVGTINLSNKGALTDTNAILGLNPSGTGTVNMTDISTSWNNSGDLDIGSQGTGILNISSGATSNEVNTILGHSAGATGTAHIDGAGSFLNSTNALTIGNMGDGTLILSNGAFAAGLTGVTLAATGGSHGKLVIGADIGQTATGAGFLTGSTPTVQFGGGTGTLVFNHTSSNYTFAQVLQGSGNIEQLAGVTHLTGDGSGYGGNVHVGGGTLYVDNSLGGFGPAITNVTGSGRLGGTGTIHGAVDIADGATLVGVQGQKLTIDGPLTLHNNSIVDATLTNPSATALFDAQDLTLDGKLNITAHGTFGPGIYRLFDYHNSITDNGLDIGTTPDGTTAADFSVHTDTTNKVVYLEDDAAAQLRFWDGNGPANNNVVDGGTGTWTATSMNFTDGGGTTNGVQTPQPGFVVFQTAAGTVTADDSAGQVGITGMQFAIDGYTVAGDAISLANAQTTLRVGDGSGASSAFNATISAVLSGTGGLNKTDLGTATLTTANTYTGLTTISQGLLALQGAGSISASSGLVDNGEFKISGVNGSGALITSLSGAGVVTLGNKTLALTAAADSFGGSINGSGGLTVAGGTEVLTGVQGYTGSTTISSGAALAISGAGSIASSLQVIADGTLNIAGANGPVTIGGLSGAGAVQLGANKLATHDNGNFSGVISGAGGLHVTGGIETLRGANTYTGGTTIDANSGVELGFNDATGSILGDVVNNGLFATNRTDSNTVANNISGIGQFAAIGTGITTLTGTNTYTGGTVDLFGTLVGSATSFGSGAIQDGFAVVLDQPTDATFANDISGSGTFEKKGAGVLAYTGAGTWTGDTTISAGTLQIGNGGTAGSLVGNVVDNGTLAFDRSDAVSFTGQLSGTGGLSQIGTGTTTLTSAETYTGLTTVSAGTLQLTGAGSINSSSGLVVAAGATFDDSSANGGTSVPTLSGDGNVGLGANTLTLTNAAGAFGGVISGTGGLVKQGTGSFNLTGASTYSGPTTVSAGRLAVNGSIANSIVTVQNGATLGGNGTVKGVIAQSGAIVAPGNSIGTLNVAGNYSQAAGSTYQVELTSTGQNDKINATGTATIENGAMLAVTKTDAADYVQGTRYTVLTAAGGVNGAYTLSGDLVTAVYGLAAHYDATHVYLDVFRAKKFVDFATTPNQTASGAALDTLPANGALTHALSNLMADADVTAALDKVSGEIHASAKTAELEDSRFPREAALGRLSTAFAQGETDSMHPSLWGQAYGSWGTNDGNGNAASLNHSSRGFLGGVDLPVANIWRVGFMGGYSRGSFNVKDRSSTGTSDNYHLSAYAGMQQGALGVRFGAAYSWHDLTTDRTVAFSGFNNDLVSQYNADTKQVYGEVGYHVPVAKVDLEPFANVAYVSLQTGPILETGGAAALTGKADTQNVTFTTLGLRGKYDITLGDTVIGTHANAGWRHAFGDLTPLSVMSFAGSSAFTIQAVPLAQDGAAYGAGFDLSVAKDVLLGVSYDGQYAPSANDNTIKLNVDWKL